MQRTLDYRFSNLALDMQTESFIFVGTNFDEINIDYYLKLYQNAGFYSSRGQLFFISPNPTMFMRSRIKDLKGSVIRWTTQQFLDFISELRYKASDSNRPQKILLYDGYQNFNDIRQHYKPDEVYNSSLYMGYEAKWQDILSEWDFVHPLTEDVLKDVVNVGHEGIFFFSLFGKAWSGKTCILMRITAELHKNGFEVLVFNGRKLQIDTLLGYIKIHKTKQKFAIIVDNASAYYFLFERLAKYSTDGKQVVVVTASRPLYHIARRYYMTNTNFTEYFLESAITDIYAARIIDKLDEKGYLGGLKKLKTQPERIQYFTEKNDVLSAMLGVTYGKGFIERFLRDVQPIIKSESSERDTLINLAIFDLADLPHFPLELLPMLFNKDVDLIKERIDDFIKNKHGSNISLRSNIFTSTLLKTAQKSKIISNIKEILIAISPQVEEYTLSYWRVIFESIFKEKILRNRFKFSSSETYSLMYDLQNYYRDLSYYWLQLGLAEQTSKEFEKALNHFRQAESIRPRSYHIQHAIGRNFLRHANNTQDYTFAKQLFSEGEKILLPLIREKEFSQVRAYSIHCYLYEKINFLEHFHIDTSNDELRNMFRLLEKLIAKDENDIMAKHISNYFYSFLKTRHKLNIVHISYYDLKKYMSLFQTANSRLTDVLDDPDTI